MKQGSPVGNFEFRALHIFVTTVEQGGMTSGAKVLGITQSGVSQAIATLEEAVGRQLFDRTVRPIVLTGAGQAFYRHGKRILGDVQKAYSEATELDRGQLASLSIAMPESLANLLGPKLYERKHEIAHFWRIFSGLMPQQHAQFASHSADIMITEDSNITDMIDVERYTILSEPYILIFPKKFPLEAELGQHLEKSKLIRFSLRSSAGRQTEAQLNRLQLKFPDQIEVDSITGHAKTVANGMGWGITTPLCLLESPGLFDDLIVKPINRGNFGRRMTLVARQDMLGTTPNIVARECRDILSEEIFPTLIDAFPWLENALRVGDD